MADRRKFNTHALYPADYCFDWESFEADPDHYKFTEEDLAYFNAIELEKYERVTPMTPYEKRALRRWVASGIVSWKHRPQDTAVFILLILLRISWRSTGLTENWTLLQKE